MQHTLRRYNPSRGGHAPGYLRDALFDSLGEGDLNVWYANLEVHFNGAKEQRKWEQMSAFLRGRWLIGQLWNCTDQVNESYSSLFDERPVTVARLVRLLAVKS
jgi:hypothetical protein